MVQESLNKSIVIKNQKLTIKKNQMSNEKRDADADMVTPNSSSNL